MARCRLARARTLILAALFAAALAVAAAHTPVEAVAAPGPEPFSVGAPGPGSFSEGAPGPGSFSEGAPAPSAPDDCLTSLYNLSDCLTYVEQGSNVTKPDKACCPELAGLVESKPQCLCQLIGNSSSVGLEINVTKALALPTACSVSTPPVSLCSAIGIHVGVPSPSVTPPSSSETALPPGSPSPAGSATTPSSENSPSGASSIADSQLACLVGLAFAFLPTFF
ncbi:non-specific lipid transfer protein GPI-anchored 2-like [Malania oleifera]|uniref:non-specific lipid transfer protein GPI-anchored 2-like n=1 Tax=Malania oleifera TaxID=397392 RepID=UPI0025ADAD41|nr:non-specific lipid transfer protein GPI-anchored 2-like [Malania oleifera]